MDIGPTFNQNEFILHLPRFDGPLDLLLYLIEKNKFTLEDLEVCPIIDQFLAYITRMRSMNIELASEFLDMASYLLWLKSCLLLPLSEGDSEETISPERELKEMLIVYLTIKQAAHDLGERPLLYRDRFPRGSSQPERSLARTGLASLLQAIEAIKARTRHYIIKMEGRQFSIREMMARIHDMLKTREKIALREAATTGGKPELIALFMAALELSRSSIARLFQKGMFGRIYIISNR